MAESDVEVPTGVVVDLSGKTTIRVLHVDDEAGFLKVAKQCLEMQSLFQVETASSVEEAMEKMKKKTFDVIVSDYVMPGKDGLEFLKELRDSGNDVPFIIFTGRGREEIAIKALNLGADRYISKGGDPETVYGELAHGIRQTVKINRAEKMLRRSEEKYRNLFENAKDVIVLLDLKGNITAINRAAVEYGFRKDEVIGKNMRKFVPKKYWPRLLKELVQIARGKTVESRIEIITPKGKKDAEYRSDPMIVDNRVVGVQGVLRDVTERERAQEALRRSEERYRSIVELAPDSIITANTKGVVTSVNTVFTRLTGFSKDEIVGKYFTEVGTIRKRDLPKYLKIFATILRGKTPKPFEAIWKHKNGTTHPTEIHVTLVKKDDKIIGFEAVTRDITERKKAEEKIRESEERLRAIFASSPDSITVTDLHGNIMECNQATVDMLGFSSMEELVGKSGFALVAKKEREKVKENLKKLLEQGSIKNGAYIALAKDGREFPAELSSSVIKDSSGKPTGFVSITRDITERKRAEEKIKNVAKFPSENPNPVLRIAKDGTILYANNAGQSLLSEWKHEIGQPALDYLRRSIANSVGSGLEEKIEIKYRDRIFSFVLTPITDADYVNVYGRDITEHKQMDEELKSSRERLNILFEFAPDAYYLNDLKGNFIDGNKAAEELTGYNRSVLIGKSFLKLKLLPRSQIPKAAKLLVKNALGKPTGPDELTLNRKDGTQVSAEIRTFPVKIKDQTLVLGIARDISERKKAEQALRESEKKLRFLLENIPDFVITVDRNHKILMINRGVPGVTVEQAIGTKVYNYVDPAHHEIMRKSLEKVFRTGMPEKYEVLGMGPKGPNTVWYETRVSPNKIDDRVISVTLISSDISGRKKAEEALRESEEKWRSLVENAPNFIMVINLDSTIEYINRTVSGFTKEETIGKSIYDFIEQKYHNVARETINQILKTGKPSKYETKVTVPQVGTYWYETLVGPLERDSKIIGATLISTDITERKKREEAIRESQQKFERLFANNPEAADYLDPTFHIIDVNPRFEELFGYSLAEIKGKHINDVVVPEDKMEEAKILDKKAGERIVHYDTVRKRRDGSLVPVSISAAPIIVDGKLMGTVGLYKDISQLKKAEKALRGTMEELKMTNEKMRVVGRLTRHDVRNKLSTVTGNIFLTKQKVSGDREALTCLDDAESAVRQVERIFDFARTYEKLGVEELAYMNVKKSVREAVSLFADLHGVKLVNDCRGLTVLADSLLRQLFYNLIDNSLRYGERVNRIRVHYKEVGKNQLELVYEDDGVGISKAEKEKIFKEGYGKGTGYGLYLIRKMCEVYGWVIKETGKHGKGAQFTITIPKMGENRKILYKLH